MTLRPWRHLSAGVAALGMQARLGGERLPVRYAAGLATRFADDTFTLSADLLADDRARDDFRLPGRDIALLAGVVLQVV